MKKLTFFLSSLGGALAGYVFSNKQLRHELAKAKDPQAAAKILGKHLSNTGQEVGKEVTQFVKSDQFQDKMSDAKKYAKDYYKKSKMEVKKLMKQGTKEAKKMFKKKPVGGGEKGKK